MFTTRNLFIAAGIVIALLVANHFYKKAQVETVISELEQMHGDSFKSKRSIKHLKTDPSGVYLEVDGKEVHIPLPEGYEILKEEEYPRHYSAAHTISIREHTLMLGALIHSDDLKSNTANINMNEERIATIFIDNRFIDRRFSINEFGQQKMNTKLNCILGDEKIKFIYESDMSLVILDVDEDIVYSKIYALIGDIIVNVEFYRFISKDTDKQKTIDDALQYNMQLNRQF